MELQRKEDLVAYRLKQKKLKKLENSNFETNNVLNQTEQKLITDTSVVGFGTLAEELAGLEQNIDKNLDILVKAEH